MDKVIARCVGHISKSAQIWQGLTRLIKPNKPVWQLRKTMLGLARPRAALGMIDAVVGFPPRTARTLTARSVVPWEPADPDTASRQANEAT